MDCRLKENPERTFDLVLKVECSDSENEDPVVLWKFPEDFGDQEVLQSMPRFCFPFALERISQKQVGQHFTFVLTDIESKQRFGFCRLTSGGKVCLCILSYLPWFEVYYKLLNTLADYLVKEQENDLNDMLKSLYNHPLPKANTPVNISVRVKSRSLEDVILLNVDTNTLESPFNDLNNLPSEVVSALKSKLKKQSTATGDGVARAFLRAQAALFGSYRDALRYKPGECITFCEDSFIKHRSSTMKHFLETAVNLQLFKQFIEGRLTKLNAGRGFTDVFEEEITAGGFCGGNSKSYQPWMQTVKKGGALINTAVTKATPAVKTAYKLAKNHAKQGIKDMKNKLKQKEGDEHYATHSTGLMHSNQSYSLNHQGRESSEKRRLAQTRLKRPITHDFALHDDEDEMDTASKLSSEDSEEACGYLYDSDESGEIGLTPQYTDDMDLLGEILDTLSIHSTDQGKLSAAKSLDFFRSMEDIDYKAKNKSSAPSENNLAFLFGESNDQMEWQIGQDDSALHRKYLPSSKKHNSFVGFTEPVSTLEEKISHEQLREDNMGLPKIVKSTSSAESTLQPDSMESSQQDSVDFQARKEPNQTLKHTLDDQIPASPGRQSSSVLIPWERKESIYHRSPEEGELLNEVVALCHFTSAFHHSINISEDHATESSSSSSGK
uniref:DENN domain-containing protein 1B isoform X4 n=1 Tax=Geotrypetes seraphini TaxID=260995 RepID=A0A6P8PDX9_GEOSA|nr:DENN domain-containing protein 1B isoform X4 [Geotrypetes seraphini]